MPWFLIYYMTMVLPYIILLEGYKKLSNHIPEKDPLWKKIYILLIALIIVLIFLLLAGY